MTALEEYYKLKNMLKLTDEEQKFFKKYNKKIDVDIKALTHTEYEILILISKGEGKIKICSQIGISQSNFYVRVSRIFKKLFGNLNICSTAIDFVYAKAPEIIKNGSYYVQ